MALSRRQIALYAAKQLSKGKSAKVVAVQLAAYLQEEGKTNEAELLIKDIQAVFSSYFGVTAAKVTSAYPLEERQTKEIKDFIKKHESSKHIELEEKVDKDLIGGFVVETPSSQLDTSVLNKLKQLKVLNNS